MKWTTITIVLLGVAALAVGGCRESRVVVSGHRDYRPARGYGYQTYYYPNVYVPQQRFRDDRGRGGFDRRGDWRGDRDDRRGNWGRNRGHDRDGDRRFESRVGRDHSGSGRRRH